ncbi:MAG: LamG domain-containing protein [Planctomycetota bacterium]|nr:LamG domain-containing protein [Planctomycetota bacterium]
MRQSTFRHSLLTFCTLLLTTATSRAADAPTLDSDPHLAAWYKFDESAGKSAADSSKNARNASLQGALSFDTSSAPGRIGQALKFDGKDSVTIPDYKGITGPAPRTISAWIKHSSNGGEIVSWGFNDAGKMFVVCFIRDRIGVHPKGGYFYMKSATNDDKWHHIAIVVRQASPPNLHDDVKLYLDSEIAEIDDIGLLDLWPIDTGDKQDVRIGARYKGLLDDLRIYSRPLLDQEITALFKLESARPLPNPSPDKQ